MKIVCKSGAILFSGSIGNMVAYIVNGKTYLRTKPLNHKDTYSEKQIIHRNKFKSCMELAKMVKFDIIIPIWNKKLRKISGFNLFMKTNMACFSGDGTIINHAKFLFSVGDLPLPRNIVVTNAATGIGAIDITWTDNSGAGIAAATDRLRVSALKVNEPVVITGLNFTRSSQQASVQLPYLAGDTVHVYLFFEDKEGATYSKSFHALVNIPSLPKP